MKPIFIFLFSLVALPVWGQSDTLFFKDGAMVTASITEVSSELVKYYKIDNLNGPKYVATISDLRKITYRNGRIEIFGGNAAPIPAQPLSSSNGASTLNQQRKVTEKGLRFSGPRIGVGYIGAGIYADEIASRGKQPIVSQFGWQFETRLFSSTTGISGVAEFVPMIAGMEQGMFLPSASFLMGIRLKDKFEFALGPTLAYPTGLSMVFAIGTSFKFEDVYFPVTLAFVPDVTKKVTQTLYNGKTITTIDHSGYRISLLFGFNTHRN